ncbi:MAG: bifunctional pyr operon transcriptional regulator/uracil phosphoribosyltransferase PyrR [Candidatus Omnitrophota bacterium]
MTERQVLGEADIQKAISRVAHEIIERNSALSKVVLVGIRTRGVYIAERIRKQIKELKNVALPKASLDITLYRDDLSEIGLRPEVRETDLAISLNKKIVVLVDDVLYTGRTIRAALDALIDFGRPEAVQLAVLIDRGHRELPIKADYVGKNLPTSKSEHVILKLKEKEGVDEVVIAGRER